MRTGKKIPDASASGIRPVLSHTAACEACSLSIFIYCKESSHFPKEQIRKSITVNKLRKGLKKLCSCKIQRIVQSVRNGNLKY